MGMRIPRIEVRDLKELERVILYGRKKQVMAYG